MLVLESEEVALFEVKIRTGESRFCDLLLLLGLTTPVEREVVLLLQDNVENSGDLSEGLTSSP